MTMWRKIIFLLLAVTLAWPRVACAQQQTSSLKYKVDYVNEKHLFRKGNQVTLLTLVLEWPERLCGSPLPALQNFLTQELFGTASTSMKSGLKAYFESLGEELSAMPDEEGLKVEYLSFVVRELAWEPDRFVSFVVAKEKRKSDTDTAELKQNKLLTYDIVRDKVLRTRDIIRKRYRQGTFYNDELLTKIWKYMPKDGIVVSADDLPDEVCLLQNNVGVVFNMKNNWDNDMIERLVIVPCNEIEVMLTKSAKDVRFSTKKYVAKPELEVVEEVVDTMKVYQTVSEMPQFEGGEKALSEFIAQQVRYPSYEQLINAEGRTVVSFIVGRDGQVSHPSVIKPVSPGIDREAARVVSAMPKWKPGKMNGEPVNVRFSIPVVFRLGF